jgi:N-acyl-D-aspartate/D-glutamate deacylase
MSGRSAASNYVIRDVRLFDGETVAERQTVVISKGTIAAVGGSTVAVPLSPDCAGRSEAADTNNRRTSTGRIAMAC